MCRDRIDRTDSTLVHDARPAYNKTKVSFGNVKSKGREGQGGGPGRQLATMHGLTYMHINRTTTQQTQLQQFANSPDHNPSSDEPHGATGKSKDEAVTAGTNEYGNIQLAVIWCN